MLLTHLRAGQHATVLQLPANASRMISPIRRRPLAKELTRSSLYR